MFLYHWIPVIATFLVIVDNNTLCISEQHKKARLKYIFGESIFVYFINIVETRKLSIYKKAVLTKLTNILYMLT